MIKKGIIAICLSAVFNAYANGEQNQQQSAIGTLRYFPETVQTREAWYGHNFMVGNTSIQPATISKEQLLNYVGKMVKITGTWNKGTEFKNDSQQIMPMPIEQTTQDVIIRNDGINADTIELFDK